MMNEEEKKVPEGASDTPTTEEEYIVDFEDVSPQPLYGPPVDFIKQQTD